MLKSAYERVDLPSSCIHTYGVFLSMTWEVHAIHIPRFCIIVFARIPWVAFNYYITEAEIQFHVSFERCCCQN